MLTKEQEVFKKHIKTFVRTYVKVFKDGFGEFTTIDEVRERRMLLEKTIYWLRIIIKEGYIPGITPSFMPKPENSDEIVFFIIDGLDELFNPLNDTEKVEEKKIQEIDEWRKKKFEAERNGPEAVAQFEASFSEWQKQAGRKIIFTPKGEEITVSSELAQVPENLLINLTLLCKEAVKQGENLVVLEGQEGMGKLILKNLMPSRGHHYESGKMNKEYWLGVCDELDQFITEFFKVEYSFEK